MTAEELLLRALVAATPEGTPGREEIARECDDREFWRAMDERVHEMMVENNRRMTLMLLGVYE